MDILITELNLDRKIGSTRNVWINPYQICSLDAIEIEGVNYLMVKMADRNFYLIDHEESDTKIKQWANFVEQEVIVT